MNLATATLVVLPSDVEADVAGLAQTHAAFDPERRRVVRFDEVIVALLMRADGTICGVLTRDQALDEAWIEDGFVRAARKAV